jgi:glycosyltransferase involved in cell wall biosynthesis
MNFDSNKPFVSVVIIAYNYASFLPKTFNACKNQTYKDFELVIVNNGSTDNTQEVIDSFMEDNKQMNIKCVMVDKNKGHYDGINVGIEAASGEYIFFNDADDWMDNDCLEVLVNCAKKTGADRVNAQFRDVDMNGKILQERNYTKTQSKWLIVTFQASLYRKSIFVDNNIYDIEMVLDDYYMNVMFNLYAKSVEFINKTVFNYLINVNSTSGAVNINNQDKVIKMYKDVLDCTDFVLKNTKDDDFDFVEYQLIKMYYFIILHGNRYSSKSQMSNVYDNLHLYILKRLPRYSKNRCVKLIGNNTDRAYGKIITWSLLQFEKLHIIKPFLYFYQKVSKRFYLPA